MSALSLQSEQQKSNISVPEPQNQWSILMQALNKSNQT